MIEYKWMAGHGDGLLAVRDQNVRTKARARALLHPLLAAVRAAELPPPLAPATIMPPGA